MAPKHTTLAGMTVLTALSQSSLVSFPLCAIQESDVGRLRAWLPAGV